MLRFQRTAPRNFFGIFFPIVCICTTVTVPCPCHERSTFWFNTFVLLKRKTMGHGYQLTAGRNALRVGGTRNCA